MRPTKPVEMLEESRSLDRPAKWLGNTASKALKPDGLKSFLAGTWMGHPVHPMLTDIPIGAWTCAFFLDLVGGERARDGADALIGIGVLAAAPTAAAGLSDYVDTWGKERRVGFVHAVGNATATALYGISYLLRRAGRRKAGVTMAMLGAGAATIAGYLGGHLIYSRGIGVNQATFEKRPDDWTAVMRSESLPVGKPMLATVGTAEVFLYRRNGSVCALSDVCTHRGGPLHEGDVDDNHIICPWHGSAFDLDTGDIVAGPATTPQPAYDVRERDGMIEVRTNDLRSGG